MTAVPAAAFRPSSHFLARNAIVTLLGQILPAAVGLLCLPPIIRSLGTERFGVLSLVWLITGYFNIFDLGLSRALTIAVATRVGRGDLRDAGLDARAAIVMLALVGLFAALLTIGLLPLALHFFKLSTVVRTEARSAFLMLCAGIPIIVVGGGLRGVLEAIQRFTLISCVRVPTGILSFLLPLIVARGHGSMTSIVLSLLVVRAVGMIVFGVASVRALSSMLERTSLELWRMRQLLSSGAWIALSNVISPAMMSLDRFLIGGYIGVSALAFYVTPLEAITKLLILSTAISTVVFPVFAARMGDGVNHLSRVYSRAFWATFSVLVPGVTLSALFAPEILGVWLGAEYAKQSAVIFQVLALGVLANGLAQIPFALLQGAGRSDLTGKMHLWEAPVYAGLLVAGAKYSGLIGVAAVWTLRTTVDLFLLLALNRRVVGTQSARPPLEAWGILSLTALGCFVPSTYARGVIALSAAGAWLVLMMRQFEGMRLLLREA